MAYVIVLLVAAAVGGGVYYLSIQRGVIPFPGFQTEAPAPAPSPSGPPTGSSYVSVTAAKSDWQSRMTGVLGLAVTVVVGAVALAGSVYLGMSWIVRLISHATKNG